MNTRRDVGSEMSRLRKEKKLTQAELAQILGISQRMVAACEANERRPSPGLAKRIDAVLGLKWTHFFDDEESEG